MQPFGERVRDAVVDLGPLCVGIDPSAALLDAWGLGDGPEGLRVFGERCVEALAGAVPVVKPQVAFFERHGSSGMAALEDVIAAATAAGLIVIADAKRGDIGTTVEAYADAWFDGPLAADAVTAAPYLGFGALSPMVAAARRTGKGLFVVVSSSNPEGRTVQEAVGPGGLSVEGSVLRDVAAANREEGAEIGSVGAVVGATRARPGGLALGNVGGVLLAPGVGAQGATAADVAALFAGCRPGTVLPTVSRSVLSAGAAGPAGLRAAVEVARDGLAAALA